MNRIIMNSRIGADGILHVTVPVGAADANPEVQATIDPVSLPLMTQEEWRNFVLATAGSITDPSFVRHEQWEFEHRADLP
jgi:hypothetical protein